MVHVHAAPGLVQSLRATSVDVTNITIQWDRVDCLQRNGGIHSYRVVYYPTSNPSDRNARFATISGVTDANTMLSVTGLPPRTNYMFQVQAFNYNILVVRGEDANLTVNTSTPQGESELLTHSRDSIFSLLFYRYWFSP